MTQAELKLPEDSAALRAVRVLIHIWIFASVLALYPYTANPAGPIKLLLTGWIMVAICVVYLYGMARERIGLRVTGSAFVLMVAFLGIHAVSAAYSDFPANSFFSLRQWLGGALLAIIAGNSFRTTSQLWNLMLGIVVAVALSSVYGYVQKFGLDPFPWSARNIEEYIGMPSTYANPNFAGHTLLLATFMGAGLLFLKRKWLTLIPLALIVSHLYFTHMRGARVAIVASIVLILFYLLLRGRKRDPVRAAAFALAPLLIAAASGIGAAVIYGNLKTDAIVGLDTPEVLRLNGYYGAARLALERPLHGVGLGNFDIESPRVWTPFEQRWFASEGKKNDHVHNDALETAAEAGFPGAVLYFALLLWGVLNAMVLSADKEEPERAKIALVLAACIGAFAVDGLFGFNLRVPVSAGLFFLMLGMLHALLHAPAAWRWWQLPVHALLCALALGIALANTAAFYADARYQEARGAQVYAEDHRAAGDFAQMTSACEAGVTILERGAAWTPFDARFAALEGQFLIALGRFKEADAAYERAVVENPYDPTLLASQAQARARLALQRDDLDVFNGKPDPAMPELLDLAEAPAQRAIALCPVLPAAEDVLGRMAYVRIKHAPQRKSALLETARENFERALKHGARDRAEISRVLAKIYTDLGRKDDAEGAFQRAVESGPENEAEWNEFAAFAVREHRTQAYTETLGRAISTARAKGGAQEELRDTLSMRLAFFYAFVLKQPALAEPIAREVAHRAPGRPDAWGLLAMAGDGTALAHLKAALKSPANPGQQAPPWIYAVAESPRGDAFVAAAAEVLQAAHEAEANNLPQSALSRNFVWAAHELSRAEPNAALDTPQQGRALASIAGVYLACGRTNEAEAAARRALPFLPVEEQAGPLLIRAKALGALGRVPEALDAARKAAVVAPGNIAVRVSLAKSLADAGKTAEAQFEFSSLLKSVPQFTAGYAGMRREAARLAARAATSGGATP